MGSRRVVSVGVKTVRFHCEWQSEVEANRMQLFVDSDWAGSAVTRRSTSGGLDEAENTLPENVVFHTGSCGDVVRWRPSCKP